MRFRPLIVPVLLALLVASGCDCCDKSILLRYDAGRDEFSYLVVYQRIRNRTDADNGAQQPGPLELDYLADLYRNRDHIIPDPEIPLLGFDGGSGILRFDAHKFAVVPLDKRPAELERVNATADLARIDNRPGQLFLRDGAAGYYHQVIVPGAVVDQVLAELKKNDLSDALVDEIQKEQERRRKGEAPPGWRQVQKAVLDEIRREMRRRVEGQDGAGGGGEADEASADRLPLSDESLAMIRKAIEKGSMISRDKSALVLRVPMTPADAEEAYTLIDDALNLARRELGRVERSDLEREKRQYEAVSVVKPKDGVLEVRLDLPMYYGALVHPLDPLPELEPPAARAADQTARALGAMLEIRQDVRLEQIIAQFNAGKLAGSGAENKGKPGEGIVKGK